MGAEGTEGCVAGRMGMGHRRLITGERWESD